MLCSCNSEFRSPVDLHDCRPTMWYRTCKKMPPASSSVMRQHHGCVVCYNWYLRIAPNFLISFGLRIQWADCQFPCEYHCTIPHPTYCRFSSSTSQTTFTSRKTSFASDDISASLLCQHKLGHYLQAMLTGRSYSKQNVHPTVSRSCLNVQSGTHALFHNLAQ